MVRLSVVVRGQANDHILVLQRFRSHLCLKDLSVPCSFTVCLSLHSPFFCHFLCKFIAHVAARSFQTSFVFLANDNEELSNKAHSKGFDFIMLALRMQDGNV